MPLYKNHFDSKKKTSNLSPCTTTNYQPPAGITLSTSAQEATIHVYYFQLRRIKGWPRGLEALCKEMF